MKVRKLSLVVIGIGMLLLSSICVSASTLTEGTGDVYHWTQTGTTWGWQYNVIDKPNIDITELSATVNENQLTLALTVSGTIENSDKIGYWVYYNTTDMSYWLAWSNGTGGAFGFNTSGGYMGGAGVMGEISASAGTITATFNITEIEMTAEENMYGYASQYMTSSGDITNEWWGDWVPNDNSPYKEPSNTGNNQTGGSDSGSKTPGFEIPLLIIALVVALIMIRRKK